MLPHSYSNARSHRQRAMSMVVASVLGFSFAHSAAANIMVSNCFDDGRVGSLRSAIGAAGKNDIVDLTGLNAGSPGCTNSLISLATGEIAVKSSGVTIQGPGENALSVSGGTHSRIFNHMGGGYFTVRDLSIELGYAGTAQSSKGGCITSNGHVVIYNSNVRYCQAYSKTGSAKGGGIYSSDGTDINYSNVAGNSVVTGSTSTGTALGGGIYTRGQFFANTSTIDRNVASGAGSGGGVYSAKALGITSSTVSRNFASMNNGGVFTQNSESTFIGNSTITGNFATGGSNGAGLIQSPVVEMYNSTIAGNYSNLADPGLHIDSPGVYLESNIFSNNVSISASSNDLDISGGSGSTVGSHNLVRVSSSGLPADTIVGKCPLLGTLRNNGGTTLTLALQSGSPAIDAGNNVRHGGGFFTDQRGAAGSDFDDFPRESGAAADIGAYEVNKDDIVFNSSFDGCQ